MLNQAAETLINRELQHAKKASLIVGVVTKDGKWIGGHIHEQAEKCAYDEHIFEIGSTTKTFTSLLLSKLVLNGAIFLDEPIWSYKPEYKKALSYNGKDVTFRHLSTHRSGLPREDMKTLRKRLKEYKDEKDNPY